MQYLKKNKRSRSLEALNVKPVTPSPPPVPVLPQTYANDAWNNSRQPFPAMQPNFSEQTDYGGQNRGNRLNSNPELFSPYDGIASDSANQRSGPVHRASGHDTRTLSYGSRSSTQTYHDSPGVSQDRPPSRPSTAGSFRASPGSDSTGTSPAVYNYPSQPHLSPRRVPSPAYTNDGSFPRKPYSPSPLSPQSISPRTPSKDLPSAGSDRPLAQRNPGQFSIPTQQTSGEQPSVPYGSRQHPHGSNNSGPQPHMQDARMNGKEPKKSFLGKLGKGMATINTLVSTANDPGAALQHVQHSKTYQQLSDHIATGQQVFDTANNLINAASDPNAAMQQFQSSEMYQNMNDRVQDIEKFFNDPSESRTSGSEEGNDSQQDPSQGDSPSSSQTSLDKGHTSRRRGFVHRPEASNGERSAYPSGTGTHSKESSKTSLWGQIGKGVSVVNTFVSAANDPGEAYHQLQQSKVYMKIDDRAARAQQAFDTASSVIDAASDPGTVLREFQSSKIYQNIDKRVQAFNDVVNDPSAVFQHGLQNSPGSDDQQDSTWNEDPGRETSRSYRAARSTQKLDKQRSSPDGGQQAATKKAGFFGRFGKGVAVVNTLTAVANDPDAAVDQVQKSKTYQKLEVANAFINDLYLQQGNESFDTNLESYPPQLLPDQPRRSSDSLRDAGVANHFIHQATSVVEQVENDISHQLKDAWNIVKEPPKKSKTLQMFEDFTAGAVVHGKTGQEGLEHVDTLIEVVGGAGGPLEQVEKGIESFMENSDILMKALGDVAKLHPFVGVAVMAFQAVWALEMKRRENDKRVLALYVEMKDMMAVLVQLKNVKDVEDVAPDGSSIKGRMQELAQQTADDIKACANACDTYTKKKLVVKILKGPVWEGRLVNFAGVFTKRRSEFEFALAIHTAVGVDAANRTLGNVDNTVQQMNDKIDMMTKMFEKLAQGMLEHKEMAKLVERKGGVKACMENDSILKELNAMDGGKSIVIVGSKAGTPKAGDFDDLREDLATDPDAAMEKNATVFNRKFEVQQRQIIDEVSRVVQREGDRIINALSGGPHDKIIDPDVHSMWKEMSWRGSVKIRTFVMTLRDYYHEKWDNGQSGQVKVDKADEWALAYVNILRMQPISEAFDDDASGYVTVQEANSFTTSRPLEWSLPHWIAYWSIGWHQSMVMYAAKIEELLAKMFAILPKIQPINRSFVNDYLSSVYIPVATLRDAVSECIINDALQEKFSSYVEAEEARLRGNLQAVDYDIDAEDTLILVTGEGRIEKYALPMIYLLLKHHFDIFRVAQKHIIHPDELWDAADTLNWVFKAVRDRLETLQSIFRQQRLDLKQHFKTFAHGLFEYMNDPSGRWDPKIVQAGDPPEYTYDDSLETQDLDLTKVLNYPVDEELKDFAAYHIRRSLPPMSSNELPVRRLVGPWNGFHYKSSSSNYPTSGMISFDIIADGDKRFKASSRSNGINFTISGECSQSDLGNGVTFTLRMILPPPHISQCLKGTWNAAADTLTGSWWTEEDVKHKGVFLYKRMSPENLRFFPSPRALKANKADALWGFAINAVRDRIRRRHLPWIYFSNRGSQRKRFVELYIRNTRFGRPLNDAELEELRRIQGSLANADHLFYVSLAKLVIRKTAIHDEPCESCGGAIGGARLSCLSCQMQEKFDTIDFCEDPNCLSQRIVRPHLAQPHIPAHDLVKLRRVVHIREFGKTYRDAKDALERARGLFEGVVQYRPAPVDDDDDDDDGEEGQSPDSVTPSALTCGGCEKVVSQPCWYCVHCTNPTFLCFTCEAAQVSIPKHDIHNHDLVRCQVYAEEVKISMEDRLTSIDERFGKFETMVDDRLSRLERLLEKLLGKVDDGSILGLDSILSFVDQYND